MPGARRRGASYSYSLSRRWRMSGAPSVDWAFNLLEENGGLLCVYPLPLRTCIEKGGGTDEQNTIRSTHRVGGIPDDSDRGGGRRPGRGSQRTGSIPRHLLERLRPVRRFHQWAHHFSERLRYQLFQLGRLCLFAGQRPDHPGLGQSVCRRLRHGHGRIRHLCGRVRQRLGRAGYRHVAHPRQGPRVLRQQYNLRRPGHA